MGAQIGRGLFDDYESKPEPRRALYTTKNPEAWTSTTGWVSTYWGIVGVHAGKDVRVPDREYTVLTVVSGGRLYERKYWAFYTERTIVTLAKRFAAEIAGGQP